MMKKNWWKTFQKDEKTITRKKVEELCLPETNEFTNAKLKRWLVEDLIAKIFLLGGGIFIAIEAVVGNPSPAWGVEATAVIIGIMMVLSFVLLLGHRIEKNSVLMDEGYFPKYRVTLKMNGYS